MLVFRLTRNHRQPPTTLDLKKSAPTLGCHGSSWGSGTRSQSCESQVMIAWIGMGWSGVVQTLSGLGMPKVSGDRIARVNKPHMIEIKDLEIDECWPREVKEQSCLPSKITRKDQDRAASCRNWSSLGRAN